MKKSVICLFVIAFMCSCGLPKTRTTYITERNYLWNPAMLPITVTMDEALPKAYKADIAKAVREWNSQVGVEFLILTSRPVDLQYYTGEITFVIAPVRDFENERDRTLALCNKQISTGWIINARVRLYFNIPPNLMVKVAIHEIGHALGLYHDKEDANSVMFPYMMKHKQHLQNDDVEYVRNGIPPYIRDLWPYTNEEQEQK